MKTLTFNKHPGPNRVFYYRLSRARRRVENSAHLYALSGTFDSQTANCFVSGAWQNEGMPARTSYPLQRPIARNPDRIAKEIREPFSDYFMSQEGEVVWQYQNI
ncbi:hypothetical protein PR048_013468 [Dryococelus australis]|uniref:Uncharacterized protein n=1 Tax=Dryococelus australis TaxID=614101 RepID=A0ABQ9HS91_9NEOP|nr:hypothetical protein PR048_013468 [Dryococelus australis]